jgi:hypothetical protein
MVAKCNNLGAAGTDATAAAQAELLATANELYQRMDAGGGGLRPDGAYWAALPAHIRNFVRTTSLSPPLHAAGGNEWVKAQAMYAIAQQMVQTGEQGEGQDQTQAASRNEVDASERDMARRQEQWLQGGKERCHCQSIRRFLRTRRSLHALKNKGRKEG